MGSEFETHGAIAHVAVHVREAHADWAHLLTRVAPAMRDIPVELVDAVNAVTAALDEAAALANRYAGPPKAPPV